MVSGASGWDRPVLGGLAGVRVGIDGVEFVQQARRSDLLGSPSRGGRSRALDWSREMSSQSLKSSKVGSIRHHVPEITRERCKIAARTC